MPPQTLTDYRDIFKAIYQPLDYCICDPGVKMTGWLFLTHKVLPRQGRERTVLGLAVTFLDMLWVTVCEAVQLWPDPGPLQASCKELFEDLLDKLETATFLWPPPKEMPEELMSEFTLDGRVQARC